MDAISFVLGERTSNLRVKKLSVSAGIVCVVQCDQCMEHMQLHALNLPSSRIREVPINTLDWKSTSLLD